MKNFAKTILAMMLSLFVVNSVFATSTTCSYPKGNDVFTMKKGA